MAYNDLHHYIFDSMGYTNHAYNGDYSWDGITPSQGILDAVTALPTTELALYDLDITTDENCLALQALVSGSQWAGFSAWHEEQYYLKCLEILDAGVGGIALRQALYGGGGLNSAKTRDQDTLEAAGFTRFPF